MHARLKVGIFFVVTCFTGFQPPYPIAAATTNAIPPGLLEKFQACRITNSFGTSLPYRLFKPANYDPAVRYPLVFMLHGAAGRGDDNARQFNGGNHVPPLAITADEFQSRHPCFMLVPQCPRSDGWISFRSEASSTLTLAMAALRQVRSELSIDPARIYLIGLSMGGSAVWSALRLYPDTFAAAVPICSAGDPAIAPKLTLVPIWCFHGDADPLVGVEYARQMVAAIRRAGGNPRYTEYPGVGHNSYERAFKEPDLLPWLFAQHRRGSATP